MRKALHALRAEPRAPGNPGILWWDRWLVAGVVARNGSGKIAITV
ncbi:MAG: hypothetical protein ACFCU2_05695 [Acidimicrobiia bacterium]